MKLLTRNLMKKYVTRMQIIMYGCVRPGPENSTLPISMASDFVFRTSAIFLFAIPMISRTSSFW